MSDDHFLSRWSKRKHAAHRGEAAEKPAATQPPTPAIPRPHDAAQAGTAAASPEAGRPDEPLPPIESLTPDSDFTAFMRPGVDPATRRAALRVLVRDPRFNVMDGLDVYIDDYTKSDPIPEEWMGKLQQLARLGDFHAKEQETAKVPENAADAPQITAKPAPEQAVGETKIHVSSDTSNKGEDPPPVRQS